MSLDTKIVFNTHFSTISYELGGCCLTAYGRQPTLGDTFIYKSYILISQAVGYPRDWCSVSSGDGVISMRHHHSRAISQAVGYPQDWCTVSTGDGVISMRHHHSRAID